MSSTTQSSNSSSPPHENYDYENLLTTLLSHPHTFYLPPTSPPRPLIPQTNSDSNSNSTITTGTSKPPPLPLISTLSLHPTLEICLHLHNRDLFSAHFLLRHAQAAPAWESMYLHGILHRMEGDVDNTRKWYDDVKGSEVFREVWGQKGWEGFLDRVERWRDRVEGRRRREDKKRRETSTGDGGEEMDWEKEEEELREISLWELAKVREFCERKFGVGRIADASSEYVKMDTKHGDIAAKMITGGEGWREF